MIQESIAPVTTRWLAISNRENSEVVIKENIWGVPKRYISAISRVLPGDTVQVYVGQKAVNKSMNREGHF